MKGMIEWTDARGEWWGFCQYLGLKCGKKRATDTKTDWAKENIVGEEAEIKRIDALLFILL